MKRYQIGEKVKLVEIPRKDNFWGMEAVYEPFERVRVKGKSGWMIVQRQENKKISFFLENLYTGKQESFVSEDSGIESWEKIKKHLDYYETMPPEYRMQQPQPQPRPQAEPAASVPLSPQEKFYEFFDEETKKIDKSFKEFSDRMKEKEQAVNYELMSQKFAEIKDSFIDLEKKLESVKPKVSLEEIRAREAGQTKTNNDVEKPADPDA